VTTGGTREIKVGLFVFIAFVLLAVVVFSISDFYMAQPQYALRVRFSFANGVEMGAPVRLAGVDVGEVKSVRIFRDEASQRMQAELGIRLNREAKIEEDAVAYINTLGLIGEKYLEIVPGTAGARLVGPGEFLVGKDSVPAEKLMESGYQVAKQLEQMIASINTLVGDEKTQAALKETLAHSAQATEKLDQLLDQANVVMAKVRSGEGTVGKLLTQDDLYRELQAILADIKAHPWKLLYRPREKSKS
jgi:phospholipid/cholesterol/gamma-HCH transport system substrate-binding protein